MIEQDSLGTLETPDDVYYGLYSIRCKDLNVTPYRAVNVIPEFIKTVYFVKKCCALANIEIGALPEDLGQAIVQAAEEGMEGKLDSHFIVDLYQGNGDVATIMNINEILAKRANEILTGKIGYERAKPNDHASCNQATTDALMSAARISFYVCIDKLQKILQELSDDFAAKANEHEQTIRVGRTELRDALPVTFGQTFSAYRDVLARLVKQGDVVKKELQTIPLGGAAIGNGIGSRPDFGDCAAAIVSRLLGVEFHCPDNYFDVVQNCDPVMQVANYQQTVAATVTKIAKDIRLLSSGPHAGLNEVRYPAYAPGSVTFPGKTNPVIEELVIRVNMRVGANSGMVAKGLENSELEYNYLESFMNIAVMESFEIMCPTYKVLLEKCIAPLEVNTEVAKKYAESTNALAIFLTPVFGYAQATKVGVRCYREGLSVKESVVSEKLMTEEEAEYFLNPINYTDNKKYFSLLKEAKTKFKPED